MRTHNTTHWETLGQTTIVSGQYIQPIGFPKNCSYLKNELNLHVFPPYAWNDKHCYGGNKTDGRWYNDSHINGYHSTVWVLLPSPTHREAEWSVSHSTAGEALLTLECAAVDLHRQSSCWWGLDVLSTTTTSYKVSRWRCDLCVL